MGSKALKNIIGKAAPLAGLIPGVGLPLAVALGAGGGLLAGGGLKGALAGGLGGAAFGGGGGLLGSALGAGGGAASTALGTGLLGAASGGITGGGKGALIGGALGGLGGYANAGGFNGILGTAAGSPLANGASGPTQGSGILGSLGRASSSLGLGNIGPSLGAGGSSYATPLISAGLGAYTNKKAEDAQLKAQQQGLDTLSPFLNQSFDASDLGNDSGYKFQLEQGNKALDRAAAARGNFFSGSALTDAANYSKGLTDTTLNDAYGRYLGNQGQKLQAASGVAGLYDNAGDVRANSITNLGNVLAGSGAGIFGGNAISNTGSILDQSPYSNISNEQLQELMRQRGIYA